MEQRGIPLHFVQLAPEIVLKALEGHDDVLASESKKAEAIYRQHIECRNGCGNTLEKNFASIHFAFNDPNWHIPRCIMRCYACGFTMNPFDGMVIATGDSDKAKYGDVPLLEK